MSERVRKCKGLVLLRAAHVDMTAEDILQEKSGDYQPSSHG